MLYLCKLSEEYIIASDRYLIKVLLVASKIAWNWGEESPLPKNQWLTIVEELLVMERLKHKLRPQEAQQDRKLKKIDSSK